MSSELYGAFDGFKAFDPFMRWTLLRRDLWWTTYKGFLGDKVRSLKSIRRRKAYLSDERSLRSKLALIWRQDLQDVMFRIDVYADDRYRLIHADTRAPIAEASTPDHDIVFQSRFFLPRLSEFHTRTSRDIIPSLKRNPNRVEINRTYNLITAMLPIAMWPRLRAEHANPVREAFVVTVCDHRSFNRSWPPLISSARHSTETLRIKLG